MTNNPWLKFPKINPQARLRLFCFPHAGSNAASFKPWSEQVSANIELCCLELPGRGSRINEPLYTHISPLVTKLAEILLPYLEPLPFVFLGHSLGALISFELARLLHQQKLPIPRHLFVSGRRAPQIPFSRPPMYKLPKRVFLHEIRKYNGTPEAVLNHSELMDLYISILRADLRINETYEYLNESPLPCPISAFGGYEDPETSYEQLDAWREQTLSSFNIQLFDGDHFYLKNNSLHLVKNIEQSCLINSIN